MTLEIALKLNAYACRTGPETDSIEQKPLRGRDSYILLLFFSNLLKKMSENNLCFLGSLVEKIITPLLIIGELSSLSGQEDSLQMNRRFTRDAWQSD